MQYASFIYWSTKDCAHVLPKGAGLSMKERLKLAIQEFDGRSQRS
jgi:hypothetical protein